MSGMLNYWGGATREPARGMPLRAASGTGERIDFITTAVVVCLATAGAFCIVIAMAWVMAG